MNYQCSKKISVSQIKENHQSKVKTIHFIKNDLNQGSTELLNFKIRAFVVS